MHLDMHVMHSCASPMLIPADFLFSLTKLEWYTRCASEYWILFTFYRIKILQEWIWIIHTDVESKLIKYSTTDHFNITFFKKGWFKECHFNIPHAYELVQVNHQYSNYSSPQKNKNRIEKQIKLDKNNNIYFHLNNYTLTFT